jgi:hypothetical protein
MWYNLVKDAALLLMVLYVLAYGLYDISWRHHSHPAESFMVPASTEG